MSFSDLLLLSSVKKMTSKASNFSDLIQRVAASCLLHPLAASRHENRAGDEEDESESESESEAEAEFKAEEEEEEEAEEKQKYKEWWEGTKEEARIEKMMEMERVMKEVFEAVSSMKRAYGTLQQAHCPWDPEKIRVADVAVVGELKRLAVLRERFRRSSYNGSRGGRSGGGGVVGVREVVAPYEAAVEELKKEVKVRSVEVENLKEKLRNAATLTTTSTVTNGKKGRSHSHSLSKNKLSSTLQPQGQALKLYPNVFFSLLTFYQFYYDTSFCWVVHV